MLRNLLARRLGEARQRSVHGSESLFVRLPSRGQRAVRAPQLEPRISRVRPSARALARVERERARLEIALIERLARQRTGASRAGATAAVQQPWRRAVLTS